MPLARLILSITAAIWMGYGGWLFIDPTGLRYAGFELTHWSAIVEVQAMYGAVEFMLGVFALLVVGRLVGIAQWGGSYALAFGAAALPDSYNPGALWLLELPSALLLLAALWRTRAVGRQD